VDGFNNLKAQGLEMPGRANLMLNISLKTHHAVSIFIFNTNSNFTIFGLKPLCHKG
jgi:hypothetical protein